MPHIGGLLQTYITKNNTPQSALARAIHREPRTIVKYKKNHSLQAAILWELSHALKHNFFADLAAALPNTFTRIGDDVPEPKDVAIAALQAEVARLQQDKELLMRIVDGKEKS